MVKKQALGRGLSALLSDVDKKQWLEDGTREQVRQIALSELHANPNQPRKFFAADKLAELAESIKSHGVMQPLIVMEDSPGYQIVAGERRFRAAELAGLREAPCLVRKFAASELAELSLLENIQREDLTALEEADAYQLLIEAHGYTQEDLAQRLGKSRSHIANTLRLQKLLPQEKIQLEKGAITAGHARALLSCSDLRSRTHLLTAIVRDGLSVRQAEALAAKAPTPSQGVKRRRRALLHAELARNISAKLGVKAAITEKQVVLTYHSEDDLQNILDAILG